MAWAEDMRSAKKGRFEAWKARVRSDWKPDLISGRCCFFFLDNGPYRAPDYDVYGDDQREWKDEGCSKADSPACGKRRGRAYKGALMGADHPRLTLDFRAGDDGDDGVVVAGFTHRFDRFVRAVEGAGMTAIAGGHGAAFGYELPGLLHDVEASLRAHGVPQHILSISADARARSEQVFQAQRAEEAALCDATDLAERMANGGDHARRTLSDNELLTVLELVADRATMVTLFCMLRASKLLQKAARSAASKRIARVRLRLLPATNGQTVTGPDAFDGVFDPDVDEYAGDLDSPAVVKFTKLKPIELDFEVRDPHHAASATFRPQKAAARFSWRWCTHDHLTWEGSGEGEHADEDDCDGDYSTSGHKVLVRWTPHVEDGMPVTSDHHNIADAMFGQPEHRPGRAKNSLPAAITLRTLRPLQTSGGEHRLGGYGLVLEHRVTERSRDEDGFGIVDGDCEVLGLQLTFGWLMRIAALKKASSYRASNPPTLADIAYKNDVIEPLLKYVRTHDLKARQAPPPPARPKKRRATSPPLGAPSGSKASSA